MHLPYLPGYYHKKISSLMDTFVSRNLSKIGPSRTSGSKSKPKPRGGKARKSRRTKIASPGAAERHQGRLPPREDLGTTASPPQSDLRATNVAWQPGVAARRDLAPVDPFARGALRPSAHPASVVAARSQRALRLAERRTPARTREVGLRGMVDEARRVRVFSFRPGRGPAPGGSTPAEGRS